MSGDQTNLWFLHTDEFKLFVWIALEFCDGVNGEVDLSDLADEGVFEAWNNQTLFEKVHIGSHREIKMERRD